MSETKADGQAETMQHATELADLCVGRSAHPEIHRNVEAMAAGLLESTVEQCKEHMWMGLRKGTIIGVNVSIAVLVLVAAVAALLSRLS